MAGTSPESVAGFGFNILGGVMDFVGGWQQSQKQRQLTDRYVGQLQKEQAKKVSFATAQGAASGVEMESSSLQKYLTDMTALFREQADWARSQGYDQAQSMLISGAIGGFSDVGKGLLDFGKANNWWRSPGGKEGGFSEFGVGGSHEGYT